LFDAAKPCKLGGEITSAREDKIMVANHPGMTDQTSSNIARDGAAKKVQKSVATKWDMKNLTTLLGLVKDITPGDAPDADPANVMSQPTAAKTKKSGPIGTSWGMKGKNDPVLGSKVLAEAANLGR
jgi:hypothetical protein